MFIYDIPFSQRQLICKILDAGEQLWKNLAGEIELNALDVSLLELEFLRMGGSPTERLLNRWGHLNATVDMLAYKLVSIRALNAFDVIKHLVSEEVLASIEKDLSSKTSTEKFSSGKTKSFVSDQDLPRPSFDLEDSFEKVVKTSDDSIYNNSVDMNDAHLKRLTFYSFVKVNFATDNFSKHNILGKGKFSITYKGKINQTMVAIKVVQKAEEKCVPQSFYEDIDLIIKHPHENLALLMAISQDGPKLCFVYQYLENGSLRDRILCKDDAMSLPWNLRHTILRDASRGLLHLHTMNPKPVLHKNIKSSSILLGTNFVAKLGDFGLLSESQGTEAGSRTRVTKMDRIAEQQAYMPDDFFRYGNQHTLLTDVYAFGMILLEACMGRDAIAWFEKSGESLAEVTEKGLSVYESDANQLISSLRDSNMSEWDDKMWITTLMLGRFCTDRQKSRRPPIQQVYDALEKCCNDIFDKISSAEKQNDRSDDGLQNATKHNDTKVLKMPTTCIRSQANNDQITDIYSSSTGGQCNLYSDSHVDLIASGEFVSIDEDISKMMAKKPFLETFFNAACMGNNQENISCNGKYPKSDIFCHNPGSAKVDVDNFPDDVLYRDKCGDPQQNSEAAGTISGIGNKLEISFSSKGSGDASASGQQDTNSDLSDMDSLIKQLLQDDEERYAKLENLKKDCSHEF